MLAQAWMNAGQLVARDPGVQAAVARSTDAATQLTSILFYEPLLGEMRKSTIGQKFGTGGRGEEVFGEQLDKQIAMKVAQHDQSGLVKKVAAKLTARNAGAPGAGLAPSGSANWINMLKAAAPPAAKANTK